MMHRDWDFEPDYRGNRSDVSRLFDMVDELSMAKHNEKCYRERSSSLHDELESLRLEVGKLHQQLFERIGDEHQDVDKLLLELQDAAYPKKSIYDERAF